MRYLLVLFFGLLSVKGFSQQSALDSIAVTIQTYINQNRIDIASKSQEGSYVLAYVNDSLYVDSSINFIGEIEFDKSKLKDSFVYHLNFIINPIVDTAIVDINTTGLKIGENAFINYGIRGEFKGGQGAFNKRILKYIKSSGYTLNDTLRFELYFDNMHPSNLLYIKSKNHEITNLIEQFYVASNKDIFYPPIHFGERLYTSYKFAIWDDGEDQKSFDFAQEVSEYESIVVSDLYIYSLSLINSQVVDPSLLVFDRKRNREDYLTKEFFSQFDSRDYEAVKQLVYKLNKSIGWGSGVLKVEIQNR